MTREIPVGPYVALVDDQDFDYLSQYTWSASRSGNYIYPVTTVTRSGYNTTRPMHRFLVDAPLVDHANRDGLDNRRANLRACTKQQNARNSRPRADGTSQYKGVYWLGSRERWVARITIDYKSHWIGSYKSETDAALAYNHAAEEFFGEFAVLNEVSE